jgi:hypothetical protein
MARIPTRVPLEAPEPGGNSRACRELALPVAFRQGRDHATGAVFERLIEVRREIEGEINGKAT